MPVDDANMTRKRNIILGSLSSCSSSCVRIFEASLVRALLPFASILGVGSIKWSPFPCGLAWLILHWIDVDALHLHLPGSVEGCTQLAAWTQKMQPEKDEQV